MPRLSRETARVGGGIAPEVIHSPELGEMEDEFTEAPPPPLRPGKRALVGPPAARGPRSSVDEALGLDEESEEVIESEKEQETLAGFHVECRVVYLDINDPKHTRYFQGSTDEIEDEAQPDRKLYKAAAGGATTYVFERFDTRGRPNASRITRDGKVFAICRHIGHLALFDAIRDPRGRRVYEVRATRAVRMQIEKYLRRLRESKQRDPDRGAAVLKAMGLA